MPRVSRFRDLGVGALHQFIGLPTIFNLTYNFNLGNGDNGNVMQIVNGRDSNRTQNFVYDSLNRVSQAYSSGPNWGETYGPTALSPGTQPATPGIDPWGNLTSRSGVTGKNTYEALTATATAKNQLTGFGYDAAGNLNQNGAAIYDAENRILSTVGYTYIYDGDGRRVEKCITPNQQNPASCNGAPAGNGTLYWLDNSLAGLESDLGWNWTALYAKFNGKRLARMDWPSNNVHFYLTDELGSADVIADEAGDIQKEADYYPYGGEIVISGSDPNKFKFTGKERDAESGNDYFGARYYASSMGRWLSPDWSAKEEPVPYAKLDNPQTLNLYGYMMNDPLGGFDPDGHTVYLITYSTGNHGGDDDFYKAALTRQHEIMSQKGFNPTKDIALVEGVNSVKSFANAIKDANGLESKFGKVGEVSLYGHGGKDGPIFQEAGPGGPSARFSNEQNPQAILGLKVNWADGGVARFMSCQAAVPSTNYPSGSFAQEFANRQGISTFGFNDRTTFSSTPVGKSNGYYFGGVNEYLVTWGKTPGSNVPKGSGPVKLDPQKQ